MYRSTDPSTSKEAAELVQRTASQRALYEGFLLAVKHDCQATALEAASKANEIYGGVLNQETLRKRYTDLLKLRLIEPYGRRVCTVTGRRCTTFRVVAPKVSSVRMDVTRTESV